MSAHTPPHSTDHEPAPAWWVAGSLLLALVAAIPLLGNPGFLNTRSGGDSPFLLFRLHQLYTALEQGVFPVRWMPDAAFGLGYPFFNYYAALPYYLAAIFRGLGFSYVLSLKLTQLLGFLVAGWGMFAWMRRVTHRANEALLAAAAYTFAPFHLVNVYVRGDSLSEFWAMAWYPLILLAIHGAVQKSSARRIALVALAFGALVMTHNVSALIFSPFVGLYAAGCAIFQSQEGEQPANPLRNMARLAVGGLLGLALAAWVWLPALAEQGVVQLGTQTTGYFFYGNHFRGANLVQPGLLFDYDTGREIFSPFSMGLVQAILTGAGGVLLIARMIRERAWWRDGFLLAGLALSTWMITPLSERVWSHVPLLPFAQFPWRFLSVQALFSAAVIGSLTPRGPERAGDGKKPAWRAEFKMWVPTGLSALVALAALGALNPTFIPLNDADVTAQRLQWYESFSGNIGTTIRYEYLPRWTVPRSYASDVLLQRPPRAKFLVGGGSAQRAATGAADQVWTVQVTTPDARIAVPLLYWPGWRAEVDGRGVPISPVEGIGYTQLDVPRGDHEVRLWLGRTATRLWAEILSALGLVITVILLRPRLPRWDWLARALAAGGIACVVVLSMILHSLPEAESLAGPLIADFAQEAYFHHSPGAAFDQARNVLSAPPHQAERGAPVSEHGSSSGVPPGLYFPRLLMAEPALTSNGQTRGDLYLEPVVVEGHSYPGDASPVDADFGFATLISAHAEQQMGTLAVSLLWRVNSEAAQHYAIALRLYDNSANTEWAGLDTQAGGAGLYPTGLWQPGEVVPDAYRLTLPEGIPPGRYALRVRLYDATTLDPVGEAQILNVMLPFLNQQPCDMAHQFSAELGIEGVTITQPISQGDALAVDVGWLIASPLRENYVVAWVLSENNEEVWQTQTPLAPDSDADLWQPETGQCGYVLGRHRLDVPGALPPGEYNLLMRLINEAGERIGEPYTAGPVTIIGRDRVFDVPPLDSTLEVAFEDQLKLWGYSIRQDVQTMTLDVAWGALSEPELDYQYFVHLFDPATETIVAQTDAMPRAYTYPTSRWTAGEVVADTISLDLRGVPPGDYRIALGWYDPASATRLIPTGPDQTAFPDGRVILPDAIHIP